MVSSALVLALLVGPSTALDNGLALTPPMGWNPWNCYGNRGEGVTEGIVLDAARAMASKLSGSGYAYVNLDCGWSTKHRDPATGELQVNATRFPHGMAWLAEQIHALGLKLGMYGALGYHQCCSGSADATADDGSGAGCSKSKPATCRNETFFARDAALWASWGVDLVKFDGCGGKFHPDIDAMRDALNATGRPIVYSVHSDVTEGGGMTDADANLWRTGPDIGASYEQALDRAMIADNVTAYLPAGPGAWADPDMLQVGNIGRQANGGSPPSLFPDAEGRTQFALWSVLKAPLLLGTFIHNVSGATLATVTNAAAIAVNQDALGEPGTMRKDGGYLPDKPRPTGNVAYGYQIWSGALSNGGAAVVLANLEGNRSQPLTLSKDEMPPSRAGTAVWDVAEAFSGATMKSVTLPLAWPAVAPHDVAMLVLTPAV